MSADRTVELINQDYTRAAMKLGDNLYKVTCLEGQLRELAAAREPLIKEMADLNLEALKLQKPEEVKQTGEEKHEQTH